MGPPLPGLTARDSASGGHCTQPAMDHAPRLWVRSHDFSGVSTACRRILRSASVPSTRISAPSARVDRPRMGRRAAAARARSRVEARRIGPRRLERRAGRARALPRDPRRAAAAPAAGPRGPVAERPDLRADRRGRRRAPRRSGPGTGGRACRACGTRRASRWRRTRRGRSPRTPRPTSAGRRSSRPGAPRPSSTTWTSSQSPSWRPVRTTPRSCGLSAYRNQYCRYVRPSRRGDAAAVGDVGERVRPGLQRRSASPATFGVSASTDVAKSRSCAA